MRLKETGLDGIAAEDSVRVCFVVFSFFFSNRCESYNEVELHSLMSYQPVTNSQFRVLLQ